MAHELTKKAADKGWGSFQICDRWGMSTRGLTKMAARATQRDTDAFNGLPDRTGGGEVINRLTAMAEAADENSYHDNAEALRDAVDVINELAGVELS